MSGGKVYTPVYVVITPDESSVSTTAFRTLEDMARYLGGLAEGRGYIGDFKMCAGFLVEYKPEGEETKL